MTLSCHFITEAGHTGALPRVGLGVCRDSTVEIRSGGTDPRTWSKLHGQGSPHAAGTLDRATRARRVAVAGMLAALSIVPQAPGQTETIEVNLELVTGGSIGGLVVDHTLDGIVIVRDTTPYVFAWEEVEAGSAYAAKRNLLGLERDGRERLTGEDHYQLGVFALSRGRCDLAGREFGKAARIDPAYQALARSAFDEYRREEGARTDEPDPLEVEAVRPAIHEGTEPGLGQRIDAAFGSSGTTGAIRRLPPEIRAKVMEVYRSFGRTVQQAIYKDLVLIETDRFLIWTDWERRSRDRLAAWCEAMYAALCKQFELDRSGNVFLAKCPVFCWGSQARFRQFARRFDGYAGTGAIGYTRSIESSGHVHIVLLLQGRSKADYDRFACTLVHEGTHAFLHRLYTTRLIPHWVNEGYADLIAERVLTERCPNAEKAALLARQYVRYDWPISHLLGDPAPIGVHEYPLAYSVVAYLEGLDAGRFAGFIRRLKEGDTVGTALAVQYDDMTLGELEAGWRSTIRAQDPLGRP